MKIHLEAIRECLEGTLPGQIATCAPDGTPNADEGTVMVVDAQNIAHETKVKVGIRTADKIEITEGLQGGETVVIEGNFSLPDGTKVEVAKEEEKKKEGKEGENQDEKK